QRQSSGCGQRAAGAVDAPDGTAAAHHARYGGTGGDDGAGEPETRRTGGGTCDGCDPGGREADRAGEGRSAGGGLPGRAVAGGRYAGRVGGVVSGEPEAGRYGAVFERFAGYVYELASPLRREGELSARKFAAGGRGGK